MRIAWTPLSFAALLATSPTLAAVPSVHFFVSPAGSDTHSGSAEAPFASLERAREAVREAKTGGLPDGGIAVIVGPGVYERGETFKLGAADSGSAEAPIVWQAEPGAEVRLSGGRSVPAEAFSPVTDDAVLQRLVPEARGQVLAADLGPLGLGELAGYPAAFRGVPPVPELFFNDQRMTVARWPNEGWATVERIIESGSNPRNGDTSNKPGIFEYSGDRPARWDVDAGVWLLGYWCFDWYEEAIQVAAIDPITKQVTFARPHFYSVRQGNPSPRRWRAINLLEELDQPGEYYLDRAANRLYFWPPADIAGGRVVLSTLNAPLLALEGASHVTVRGFTVETGLADGLRVTDGEGVRVEACDVRNLRQQGIVVNGGTAHTVIACDIHETGTGGLHLGGGDRKTLTPAGHEAINNHIWGFSRHQLTYANGLTLAGVGNRGAHNLLHDAPHQAVSVSGNDHVFELNVIHHVCLAADDAGAFYKGRNPSMRGNIIRHNLWHNIGSPMGHGNAAVYFDDGDGGETVVGNVFFRCGDPGKGNFGTIFSHGGHDIAAENNIFVECRRAVGSSPWNNKRWADMLRGALWQERLTQEVDITQPPYTTHYPALVGYMSPDPDQERVNRAKRNLFVMVGEVSSGNWKWSPDENLVTDEDPGFVDMANGDFRLKPDSIVFEKLPGFEPIPLERMGLYADALRPNPVQEPWPYDPPKPLPPPEKRGSSAAAPPPPRTGPAPKLKLARTAGAIAVDGSIEPAEWAGVEPVAMKVNYDTSAAKHPSTAWIAHDGRTLYIAVDNAIDPQTSLDGNQWGSDEAVEVSLRPGKAPAGQLAVIRAYGNGRVEYGTTPHGGQEPKTADPGGIAYKVTRPEPGRWVAELAIPFAMLDLDIAQTPQAAFSLTVRKAADNQWVQWEATRGNSYNADAGGILVFGE